MTSETDSDDRGPLQFETAYHIILAARRWRARFTEKMRSNGLTDARWTALYMLGDAPDGVIQSDLAERLGIQGPTLVRILDALEEQGLVERRPSQTDRRAKVIELLPKGRRALGDLDQLAAELRDEVFAGASDDELRTSLELLKGVVERLSPVRPLA